MGKKGGSNKEQLMYVGDFPYGYFIEPFHERRRMELEKLHGPLGLSKEQKEQRERRQQSFLSNLVQAFRAWGDDSKGQ